MISVLRVCLLRIRMCCVRGLHRYFTAVAAEGPSVAPVRPCPAAGGGRVLPHGAGGGAGVYSSRGCQNGRIGIRLECVGLFVDLGVPGRQEAVIGVGYSLWATACVHQNSRVEMFAMANHEVHN